MKALFHRIPKLFKNFYFLALIFFVIWMTAFDSNDFITQYRLSNKLKEMKKTKAFYEEKIEEVKDDREALLNSDELLEKVAREKYLMKKPNEDVYVIVKED